jgi:choline dehydrogenase-like flavoprotein
MHGIVDARSVPENKTFETDVCIVGAGVAGITLAREFMGQEFRVCVLESGDLKFNQDIQSLCAGESVGHLYFPLHEARARFLGGSANFWHIDLGENRVGARLRPLDPIDFETRDWVPHSGWPFNKSALDPFYDRAQAICQIGPSTYDVKHWEDPEKAPRLPLRPGRAETIIFKFGRRELFTKDYAYETTRRADNILTFLFANAIEIETDEPAKTVTRLHVACLEGNRFCVTAKIFILAAGGIETPRLLLVSNKTQNVGLGNQHDLVGRFFMEHLHFWSGLYIPSKLSVYESAGLYKSIRRVEQVPIIGKLVLTEAELRRRRLLNQNFQLMPCTISHSRLYRGIRSKGPMALQAVCSALRSGRLPSGFLTHLSDIVRGIDDIAINGLRKIKRKAYAKMANRPEIQAFRLAHMAEQMPNPESRVMLAADRDRLGLNRVRLNWQLSPSDILSTVRSQQILDAELRRAGLGRLLIDMHDASPPQGLHGGYHHMGTTRMHVNPKHGVIDANCRVHGLSNLFVAGPSVFPTGGYANPVLTVVALAVRLADHVKKCLR